MLHKPFNQTTKPTPKGLTYSLPLISTRGSPIYSLASPRLPSGAGWRIAKQLQKSVAVDGPELAM
jgi:hypothetical protein